MLVAYSEIAQRYKQFCDEMPRDVPPFVFAQVWAAKVAEAVGLCDGKGRKFFREGGGPAMAPADKRRFKPSDFRFDMLAEAMIGREWKSIFRLGEQGDMFPGVSYYERVQEESAAPIGPSVWANVAAWTATTGGLMNAQFNLGYDTPDFELADLFPIREAIFYQGGERIIDILGPFSPAQETAPGAQYPDNSMSALWVEPGAVKKYAGKIEITKETLEIDISGGQILSKANDGGYTLRFRENELAIDAIVGTTNNFKLGMLADSAATTYNTYGPTITNPAGTSRTVTNDIVNPLSTPDAFMQSDMQISNLYHPVTDMPIVVDMPVCVLPTPLAKWAMWLQGVGEFSGLQQTLTSPMAVTQPAPGTFPNTMAKGQNPWQNYLRPIVSRWLDARHIASTTQADPNRSPGLGLSTTTLARMRWYRLNPAKFACRRQKWGPTSQAISASDYVMATQGIAAAFAWDMATMVQVLSPFHIQRNKGA